MDHMSNVQCIVNGGVKYFPNKYEVDKPQSISYIGLRSRCRAGGPPTENNKSNPCMPDIEYVTNYKQFAKELNCCGQENPDSNECDDNTGPNENDNSQDSRGSNANGYPKDSKRGNTNASPRDDCCDGGSKQKRPSNIDSAEKSSDDMQQKSNRRPRRSTCNGGERQKSHRHQRTSTSKPDGSRCNQSDKYDDSTRSSQQEQQQQQNYNRNKASDQRKSCHGFMAEDNENKSNSCNLPAQSAPTRESNLPTRRGEERPRQRRDEQPSENGLSEDDEMARMEKQRLQMMRSIQRHQQALMVETQQLLINEQEQIRMKEEKGKKQQHEEKERCEPEQQNREQQKQRFPTPVWEHTTIATKSECQNRKSRKEPPTESTMTADSNFGCSGRGGGSNGGGSNGGGSNGGGSNGGGSYGQPQSSGSCGKPRGTGSCGKSQGNGSCDQPPQDGGSCSQPQGGGQSQRRKPPPCRAPSPAFSTSTEESYDESQSKQQNQKPQQRQQQPNTPCNWLAPPKNRMPGVPQPPMDSDSSYDCDTTNGRRSAGSSPSIGNNGDVCQLSLNVTNDVSAAAAVVTSTMRRLPASLYCNCLPGGAIHVGTPNDDRTALQQRSVSIEQYAGECDEQPSYSRRRNYKVPLRSLSQNKDVNRPGGSPSFAKDTEYYYPTPLNYGMSTVAMPRSYVTALSPMPTCSSCALCLSQNKFSVIHRCPMISNQKYRPKTIENTR